MTFEKMVCDEGFSFALFRFTGKLQELKFKSKRILLEKLCYPMVNNKFNSYTIDTIVTIDSKGEFKTYGCSLFFCVNPKFTKSSCFCNSKFMFVFASKYLWILKTQVVATNIFKYLIN